MAIGLYHGIISHSIWNKQAVPSKFANERLLTSVVGFFQSLVIHLYLFSQGSSPFFFSILQFYLADGPVTVDNDGEKFQVNIDAVDLLRCEQILFYFWSILSW